MFLVRRKSDGKWWLNKYTDSKGKLRNAGRGQTPDNIWVDDPSQCWPFMTRYGAKHSQQSPPPVWERLPEFQWQPTTPDIYERSRAHRLENKRRHDLARDEQFEIVPVKVKMEIG